MKVFFLCLLITAALADSAVAAEGNTRWHVVLAAVGNEQNVFDNFVNDFAKLLKGHNDIASFTELHASNDERWPASGLQALERTITALKPQEGEGCLIYLTGHGAPDGLAMSADTPMVFVRPTRMESMLNSCAGRPTILVVSACFSGVYVKPGITRPERIVLTASAPNLTSFGCSNNLRYTFFDQCFIDAWPHHDNWGTLADDVKSCVNTTERRGNFPASNPQVFFGPNMRALALPALETRSAG
ncbi:MAG TPA: C13 family peptidase [Candidatus Acidoferrum sp.]|nr:C13 family peptidase [Candidatus Acidoferrum sp.]